MKLRGIINESTKSDFYDMYAILASPHALDSNEGKALLWDRTSRLIEKVRTALYLAIVDNLDVFQEPSDTMQKTIKRIARYRSRIKDNWTPLFAIFDELSQPPHDPYKRAMLLDKFFGQAHNNGPITDHLNMPWLFDALYTRALADANELISYASPDAKSLCRSANHGLNSKRVTGTDKLKLLQAKQKRGHDSAWPQQPIDWIK